METEVKRVLCQFRGEDGSSLGSAFDLPIDIDNSKLNLICNALLQKEEHIPFSFYIGETEIVNNLFDIIENERISTEGLIEIIYQPQAVFKVRPVTRCSSTLEGHAEAVIAVSFSPDGRYLASGSGDTTVRFWDINTETPQFTCRGHNHWILFTCWSPDGRQLASACKNGLICLWNPQSGKQIGKSLTGHKQWINWLSWQPLHLNPECRFLASASKDGTVKVWDTILGNCVRTLSGHMQSVTAVRWGGTDLIYSASQDRTVKVWRACDGVLCRTLEGHGHWVNTLALNTDYVMRTGAFEPAEATAVKQDVTWSLDELRQRAQQRYDLVKGDHGELLVSGSDDFTLFLWRPESERKPVTRMTGHQQLINDVRFSPDTRIIASASFDKSIKLWDGKTGKYLASLRGHVSAVYQISWSADSRLLVSGSSDSTLKVWDMRIRKLMFDLPGHADEVYAVDWSPDGQKVASGGKDKVLKLWQR